MLNPRTTDQLYLTGRYHKTTIHLYKSKQVGVIIFRVCMGKSSQYYGSSVIDERPYYPLPHILHRNNIYSGGRYASSNGTSTLGEHLFYQQQHNGSRSGICTNEDVLAVPHRAATKISSNGVLLYDYDEHQLTVSVADNIQGRGGSMTYAGNAMGTTIQPVS